MIRIWSELRAARFKEQAADVATVAWVVLWGVLAWLLFEFLASFVEAARTIRSGGDGIAQSGRDLGDSLAGIPLVGAQLHDVARDAFASAGQPFSAFGIDLERLILVLAAALALLLLAVTLVPWLSRYVPWRWGRLRRTRAGHRAIRIAPSMSPAKLEEVLALRAVARLEYGTLLAFTPDPLGDWVSGRHDRLARAELASVGLRP